MPLLSLFVQFLLVFILPFCIVDVVVVVAIFAAAAAAATVGVGVIGVVDVAKNRLQLYLFGPTFFAFLRSNPFTLIFLSLCCGGWFGCCCGGWFGCCGCW